MLPKPPPDAPVPPPSGAAIRSQRKWRMLWITGCLSILILAGMAFLVSQQQRLKAKRTEAISNLRSMSLAFYEFESAYGSFPNGSTATSVRSNTGTDLPLGDKSSNDYFRQLLAAEIVGSEGLFHAEIPGCRKPDYLMDKAHALEKGEVGFSYIVGLDRTGDPKRPLVVTPLIPGTDKFDPKPFGGYAIILPVDGSITRTGPFHPINSRGEVIDSSGKHILDRSNPIWGGKAPRIVWPE